MELDALEKYKSNKDAEADQVRLMIQKFNKRLNTDNENLIEVDPI